MQLRDIQYVIAVAEARDSLAQPRESTIVNLLSSQSISVSRPAWASNSFTAGVAGIPYPCGRGLRQAWKSHNRRERESPSEDGGTRGREDRGSRVASPFYRNAGSTECCRCSLNAIPNVRESGRSVFG